MALTTQDTGRNPIRPMEPRLFVAMWIVGLAFLVLVGRLYVLQVLRGEELASKGEANFVQLVRIPHDRGIVYDRYGRILVDNRPSLDAQVIPAFLGRRDDAQLTLERLARILDLPQTELARVSALALKRGGLTRFQPVMVKRDLTPREVDAIEAERGLFRLDGVDIVEGRKRYYPHGALAAHLLGYVNEIDPSGIEEQKASGNPLGYVQGDVLGRDGVERARERELRGNDGSRKIVVDAKGRRRHDAYTAELLGSELRVEPRPGNNVHLTLDLDLQHIAEAALAKVGQAGAVVALEVNTGAILAMVSMPEFDPNLASGSMASTEKRRLDLDPLRPWLNRPIQGQYAPGSTFKVFTGLAALASGVARPSDHVNCPGAFRLGSHVWRCHKESGHGSVELIRSLAVSCDVYYYTMASRMGIDAIAQMGRRFGLGKKTGIALVGEKNGIMPDEAFHDRVDKASGGYQKGMAINTAIGQGSVLVTPMQLTVAYAAVANGGSVYTPQFVQRVESPDLRVTRRRWVERTPLESGSVIEEVQGPAPEALEVVAPVLAGKVDLPPELFELERRGLTAVTSEPFGTAYYRASKNVSMAGKTGTAQVVRLGTERLKEEEMDYFQRDHAWFGAFAPAESPEIAIVVLNEHGGHGGSGAAPVATEVIDAYFALRAQRDPSSPLPPKPVRGTALAKSAP